MMYVPVYYHHPVSATSYDPTNGRAGVIERCPPFSFLAGDLALYFCADQGNKNKANESDLSDACGMQCRFQNAGSWPSSHAAHALHDEQNIYVST